MSACPDCGNTNSEVVETRRISGSVRRRRRCVTCQRRWTTYEVSLEKVKQFDQLIGHLLDQRDELFGGAKPAISIGRAAAQEAD
jgi:transcriptional repressor NrdR